MSTKIRQCKNCRYISNNDEVFCPMCGESFLADPLKRWMFRRKQRKHMNRPLMSKESMSSYPIMTQSDNVYDPSNWSPDYSNDDYDPNPFIRVLNKVIDTMCGPLVVEPTRVVVVNQNQMCTNCGWQGSNYMYDAMNTKYCPRCRSKL